MARVAVLDDHPAVLAGLQRLIERAGGLEPVLVADATEGLFTGLDAARPDVVVVDYDLARGDGLTICQRLKERAPAPGVVLYSAYAGLALAVAAWVAGADGLVDKRAPASALVGALRRVAAGGLALPEVPAELREAAMARLDPDEVPVAAMRLAGTSHEGIADTLDLDRREVVRRTRRIVGRLRPKAGAGFGGGARCTSWWSSG